MSLENEQEPLGERAGACAKEVIPGIVGMLSLLRTPLAGVCGVKGAKEALFLLDF
jgi:hypothetical protein